MASHNAHTNMPEGAVLADDCERCYQHAEHPFSSLDDDHLNRLNRMVINGITPLTGNDYKAIREIMAVKAAYRRLQSLPSGPV